MNRLGREQSPYLLQHKDNPVHWQPWDDDAFSKAKREDKPIFLSIGYSTCHWCHVMEHESFEDEDVASLLNEAFVSVKVDREERPDIDALYMTVCQMMTGQGGWPLTIIMTPDKKPFYAATYLPKQSRFQRPGLMELVPHLHRIWKERRDDVEAAAEQVTGALAQSAAQGGSDRALDADILPIAYSRLAERFDAVHGGFGARPKFPTPHHLLFLLRYGHGRQEQAALQMVEKTLHAMRLGGIYDHVGFGFHRYATDAGWLVPHFEKMLYDQAMLGLVYTEAFQATREAFYLETAGEVFTYVLRDLGAPGGGFYSAEDADSEGEEGKFYLWTLDEIRSVLDPEAADLVVRACNVSAEGNYLDEATRERTGANILYFNAPVERLAAEAGLSEPEFRTRFDAARSRLFAHRERRIRPGLDDKVLADWNGLMIGALARAARVFEEPAYRDAAERAAAFVLSTLRRPDGSLLHRYRDGHAGLQPTLEDYAFVVWGLLELYESTFTVAYLDDALALTNRLLADFWDDAHGGFFMTPADGEPLLVRPREPSDGAIPSGNSIAMMNLLRLGRLTGRPDLEARAEAIATSVADIVRQLPTGFTALLTAYAFALGPTREVVITGDPEADDTRALVKALHGLYTPDTVVLQRAPGPAGDRLVELAPFVEAMKPANGSATAYVCRHYACHAPTHDPDVMIDLLTRKT